MRLAGRLLGRNGSVLETLDRETAFRLLAVPRRARVVEHLDEHGATAIRPLSVALATAENGVPAERLSRQQRKRVYVSLYQTHLPTLAENDVVVFDRGDVEPGPALGELVALLDVA